MVTETGRVETGVATRFTGGRTESWVAQMKLLSRNVTAPLPAVAACPVTSISLAPLQNFLGKTRGR